MLSVKEINRNLLAVQLSISGAIFISAYASRAGAVAFSFGGKAVGRCRKPAWRRCQSRSSSGNQNKMKYTFSNVRFKQSGNCGSPFSIS
jgi:hypothetical protein